NGVAVGGMDGGVAEAGLVALSGAEAPGTEAVGTEGRRGLTINRYFTQAGLDPFTSVEWERRSAVIYGEKGEVVFEQHDVEMPKAWTQLATNVVVSKYFRGPLG